MEKENLWKWFLTGTQCQEIQMYLTQGDYKELNRSLQPCLLFLKSSLFSESHLYSLLSVDQLPLLFHVTAAGGHP